MATVHADAVVTADELKEIIDTDLTDSRLHNFINMAYATTLPLVGQLSSCGGSTTLKQIQLLLAAHYLTMYERSVKSQSIGGEWSVTYALQDGEGIKSSLYGQNAIALDCSGTLGQAGVRKATFKVFSHYQGEIGYPAMYDADIV